MFDDGSTSENFEKEGWKSPNSYHNDSVDADHTEGSPAAFEVIRRGLSQYPYDIDLLSDAVLHAPIGTFEEWITGGDLKKLDETVAMQAVGNGISRLRYAEDYCAVLFSRHRRWNWRSYCYVIDYLKERRVAALSDISEVDRTLDLAIELAKEFVEKYPSDERAHNELAEALIASGDQEAAERYLRKIILEDPLPAASLSQSCTTLVNILMDKGEYGDAIKVALVGQAATAQSQPSSVLGFFVYCEALARDAMLMMGCFDGSGVGSVREEASEVISLYETAKPLLDGRTSYLNTIGQREVLLVGRFLSDRPSLKCGAGSDNGPSRV